MVEAGLAGMTVAEARERSISRIPIGRMAQPDEIASSVLFLDSEKASYLTGVSISMDGAAALSVARLVQVRFAPILAILVLYAAS